MEDTQLSKIKLLMFSHWVDNTGERERERGMEGETRKIANNSTLIVLL